MATGLDRYCYYNTGTYGSPTWTLMTNVKDLDKTADIGMADGSSRASGSKQNEPTLLDFGLSFGYVYKSGDAVYAAMRTAALAKTTLDFALADGLIATTGTKYIRTQQVIKSWKEAEPLEDVVMASIDTAQTDVISHPANVVTVA